MLEAVERELAKLVQDDIIEPVNKPTTEIAYDMNGAKVMSVLDLNKLVLEEDSKDITTFITRVPIQEA